MQTNSSLDINSFSKIQISNFKSIKEMKIDCERVNIFIGEPNVGKSNILESLALVSMAKYSNSSDLSFVRYSQFVDLFYNQDITKNGSISIDNLSIELTRNSNGLFNLVFEILNQKILLTYHRNGNLAGSSIPSDTKNNLPNIKYYKFDVFPELLQGNETSLIPYKGENLLNVISKNKDVEEITKINIGKYGLRLITDRSDNKIKLLKDEGDEIVALPFKVLSDGLQRHIFNQAALLSNKDSILVMEEPESHTFPFLTKNFSELVAKDESNQFFITTHNPYFVNSIIEKTKKEQLGIFIVYFEDYQTKIKKLTKSQVKELLNYVYDLFFNLEKFLE